MSIMRLFKRNKRKDKELKFKEYIGEVLIESNKTYVESKPLVKDQSIVSFVYIATCVRDFLDKVKFLRDKFELEEYINESFKQELEITNKLELDLDRLKKSIVQLMREDEGCVQNLPDYLDLIVKDSGDCKGKPLDSLLSKVRKECSNIKLDSRELVDTNNIISDILGAVNSISVVYGRL